MTTPRSARRTRRLACQLAAQVCQGHLPAGHTLLSYIVMFENYIELGANDTGKLMGWDVVERPPVVLSEVRARIRETLT